MAPLSVNEEIAPSNWKDPEALLLEQEEQYQVDRQTQHVESLLPYLANATLQGVLLRTLRGDIPEEIGARLGLSVDVVKQMIQEGAMRLKELVAQHPAPKGLASAA